MSAATGHPFYYFLDTQNPARFYTLGTWASMEAHADFIASDESHELVELVKEDVVFPIDEV